MEPWEDRYGHAEVVARVDPVERRAEWLELRRAGIGGSDAAAIAGQSKYTSALELYLEKTGVISATVDNEAMFWGRTLEGPVADVLEVRTGVELEPTVAMLRHPEHRFMQATPDRHAFMHRSVVADLAELAGQDLEGLHGWGIAEIKTSGHFTGDDWRKGKVPDHYVLQGMHYLAVTGQAYCLFGCLVAGQRLIPIIVRRDDELIDHLITLELEFWLRVLDRDPPPPDGSAATTELLAHLWDVKPNAVVELEAETVDALIARRDHMKRVAAAAEYRQREAENKLKWLIGDNAEAIAPGGRRLFTWKADVNGRRRLHIPKPTKRKALPPT